MTSSKQAILSAIRRHALSESPLPTLDQEWIEYPDPVAQFVTVLESVGGRAVLTPDAGAINTELATMSAWTSARKVVSLVAEVGTHGPGELISLDQLDNPHATEDVDFAILPGEFAVAENGAVWISDSGVKHRSIYFIAQHLALVVPRIDVVNNMHAAYRRLGFESPRFGAFISGPSKTADIEQSLVIGAHGPRSMTVFLLG